jgi:hypothetical protein
LQQAQQEREQAARMNSEKLKAEWQNYLRRRKFFSVKCFSILN